MRTHANQNRRRGSTPRLVAVAVLAILAASCTRANQVPLAPDDHREAASAPTVFMPSPAFASAAQTSPNPTIADIAERVVPAVVNISVDKVSRIKQRPSPFSSDPFFREFFGRGGPRQGQRGPTERHERSLGSGVIVSTDGVVVTNNHVVENADEVRVALADGREFDAKLVGADPKSDLAVLRLQGKVENLTALQFGDSSAMRLGEVVMAVGNPFGVGQTVTMGIVSAKGRGNVGIVDYEDFIQTDAAINPGNSGGALVNMHGELVGINTAILSRSGGYQGIGFAIPADLARPVLESLTRHGKVLRGWLGVSIQTLNDQLADGLETTVKRGVLVSDVMPDGPAARAGIKRGDVIVKMNGVETKTTSKLRNRIAIAGPDAVARLEIVRGGETMTLEATLGELASDSNGKTLEPSGGVLDGARLEALGDANRERLELPDRVKRGVVVTALAPGSAASRAGLRVGDVVREVNRAPVATPGELESAIDDSTGTLLLLVQRGQGTMFITVRR